MEDKKQALANLLKISINTITNSDYDDNLFYVNQKTQKAGKSPQYYIDTITEFKKILEPVTIKKIDAFLKGELLITTTNEAYQILRNEIPTKPVIKDWLYNENILYHLLDSHDDNETHTNLVTAWKSRIIYDDRKEETVNDGEYLVLTDEEAEKAYEDSLENYIDEVLEIPDEIEPYFDRERWKEDARINSSRGNELNHYDGSEEVETVNETDYYIYRQN